MILGILSQTAASGMVWLSPALEFDYGRLAVRIYGLGTKPISWVLSATSAKFPQSPFDTERPERNIIQFRGPEAKPT